MSEVVVAGVWLSDEQVSGPTLAQLASLMAIVRNEQALVAGAMQTVGVDVSCGHVGHCAVGAVLAAGSATVPGLTREEFVAVGFTPSVWADWVKTAFARARSVGVETDVMVRANLKALAIFHEYGLDIQDAVTIVDANDRVSDELKSDEAMRRRRADVLDCLDWIGQDRRPRQTPKEAYEQGGFVQPRRPR